MHNCRENILDKRGFKRTRIYKDNAQWGTGKADKFNREIFEGDKVRVKSEKKVAVGEVILKDACFVIIDDDTLPLNLFAQDELEIIGD